MHAAHEHRDDWTLAAAAYYCGATRTHLHRCRFVTPLCLKTLTPLIGVCPSLKEITCKKKTERCQMPKAATVPGRGSILFPQLASIPVCVCLCFASSLSAGAFPQWQIITEQDAFYSSCISVSIHDRSMGCKSINTGQFFSWCTKREHKYAN